MSSDESKYDPLGQQPSSQSQQRLISASSDSVHPDVLLDLDSSLGYSPVEHHSHHSHHAHHQSAQEQMHGAPQTSFHGNFNHHLTAGMLDMHASANSLSAPSPPDSASPVSMSTSPIPPVIMNLNNERLPEGTAHPSIHHTLSPNGYNVVHLNPQPGHGPYLRITEQPTNRIRYRYKSEKGSHGGLTGESSSQTKKTYPTVKLENYRATGQVLIKASLVTNDDHPKPHVHKLMGRHCNADGICMVPLTDSYSASFQNLGILFIGKKEVPEILFQRKLEEQRILRAIHNGSQLSESEKQRLREEAERDAKDMNLNCVRICFEAFDCNHEMNFPVCEPICSRPVANQKSPDSGELKIVRMDKYAGVCTGDEEVFLLCEKVNKKEIKVRFFEADGEGKPLWEAFANFSEADVHHQVAIVFRTPPYRDVDVDEFVQVYLQLYRPKDGEYSEPRPFTYYPKEHEKGDFDTKRKKASHGLPSSPMCTDSRAPGQTQFESSLSSERYRPQCETTSHSYFDDRRD